MGIGLWFSHQSVVEASQAKNRKRLRDWLERNSFVPFTANAFPQIDFHQPVVKHAVYEPDWTAPERLAYTRAVFALLHELNAAGLELSVSTLPLGWPRGGFGQAPDAGFFRACAEQLLSVCRWLEQLEQSLGRLAYLCIEPEPGCVLDSSDDVIRFFDEWLSSELPQRQLVRRYLRVCHDICHSAVVFEPQSVAVAKYRAAEIAIGKVQISSALEARFGSAKIDNLKTAAALQQFVEPRYLHQTSVQLREQVILFEDLDRAFLEVKDPAGSRWRTHFHVPVFLSDLGTLHTTNGEIRAFAKAVPADSALKHFEVETYAWSVLPSDLQRDGIVGGIARELNWARDLWNEQSPD
jgi:hypothetical protein